MIVDAVCIKNLPSEGKFRSRIIISVSWLQLECNAIYVRLGARDSVVVEPPCCKQEGRGFETQRGN
jgi:hypothetical protein